MSEKRDIAKDRAMCEAATKGPWQWRGYTRPRKMYLASLTHMIPIVMDFERWGMRNAQPRFRDASRDLMVNASDLVIPDDAENPNGFHGINHADAKFIVEAREALPHYLARTAEAESKVATVEGERDKYKVGFEAAVDLLANTSHARLCRWIDDECEHHRKYPDCRACLTDRLLPKEAQKQDGRA
jgi:hypothetical protein